MKEKIKRTKPIHNILVLALCVFMTILAARTSVKAQNYAPLSQTGQTKSYASGDDGDLQMGVQWPNPRFIDNGDGTVMDNLTELIWLKSADCFGGKVWTGALEASNSLADGQCGLSDGSMPGDWCLPNARELLSLIDYGNYSSVLPSGHPFTDVRASHYWSSTTTVDRIDAALLVNMFPSTMEPFILHDAPKDQNYRVVWPVFHGNEVVYAPGCQRSFKIEPFWVVRTEPHQFTF